MWGFEPSFLENKTVLPKADRVMPWLNLQKEKHSWLSQPGCLLVEDVLFAGGDAARSCALPERSRLRGKIINEPDLQRPRR
jgi:hypothetical protein